MTSRYWDRWELHMRKTGDMRRDAVVKKELYQNFVVPSKREIAYVLDDRNQMVDMWRKELGLPCLQVWYGDF
jgi:hypothetical protein